MVFFFFKFSNYFFTAVRPWIWSLAICKCRLKNVGITWGPLLPSLLHPEIQVVFFGVVRLEKLQLQLLIQISIYFVIFQTHVELKFPSILIPWTITKNVMNHHITVNLYSCRYEYANKHKTFKMKLGILAEPCPTSCLNPSFAATPICRSPLQYCRV